MNIGQSYRMWSLVSDNVLSLRNGRHLLGQRKFRSILAYKRLQKGQITQNFTYLLLDSLVEGLEKTSVKYMGIVTPVACKETSD